MNNANLLYQIVFTLEYGIQQLIYVNMQEAAELLDKSNSNHEIIFKHIKFHSSKILTTQLFKKSLVTNKYEPFSFFEFEEERREKN